jgi:hypothetical protein
LYSSPDRAALLAERALESASLRPQSRVNALLVRGLTALQSGKPETAASAFEELHTIRRFADDSVLLAESVRERDPKRALSELRRAAAIQPFRADLAAEIAGLLNQSGRRAEADRWQQLAVQLLQRRIRPN